MPPATTGPTSMMMPNMMPEMMSGVMPLTAMTPYGMQVVGYQPVMNNMPQMPMQYSMQYPTSPQMAMLQQQLMQQQMMIQMYQAQLQQLVAAQQGGATSGGESDDNLKTPMPINGNGQPDVAALTANPFMLPGMTPNNMFAMSPYAAQYAQNAAPTAANADATQKQVQQMQQAMATMMNAPNPMMFGMVGVNPAMNNFVSPAGMNPTMGGQVVMTPYGLMVVNPMMNNGFGMNMNMGMSAGNNMSMFEMLQLISMLNQQNQRPRFFQRLAMRRAERMQQHQCDPFQMLMQAWSTPYYPSNTSMRMPSRNAYPYGYFGAQPESIQSANYGGLYNFYTGSTEYPGLF